VAMMHYKGIMILLNQTLGLHYLTDLIAMTPFLRMFLLLFL
jgi:hypothetical protein